MRTLLDRATFSPTLPSFEETPTGNVKSGRLNLYKDRQNVVIHEKSVGCNRTNGAVRPATQQVSITTRTDDKNSSY